MRRIIMNESNFFYDISEETVAAWIDGTLSSEQEAEFLEMLADNRVLSEIIDSIDDVETEFETLIEQGFELPEELTYNDFELPSVAMADDVIIFDDNTDSISDAAGAEDPSFTGEDPSDRIYHENYDSDVTNRYTDHSHGYNHESEDKTDTIEVVGYNDSTDDEDGSSSLGTVDEADLMF